MTALASSRARRYAQRVLSVALGALNRGLDRVPFARAMHRRVLARLEMPEIDLPLRSGCAGLDGLRIAFVTDVHAGSFLGEREVAAIFDQVQAQDPDLVLFGGDLINTRARVILLFRVGLRRLRPRYGAYAVSGNHDHYFGPDIRQWRAFLEDHGVTVLDNQGLRIRHGGESLWLCGVDDMTEGAPDLRAALAGRRDGETTLLVSHHPDFFTQAAGADVDLQLSGHTHGGQIRVAGRAPLNHSRLGYERGWFGEGHSRLYVSRGVGVTLVPVRIDAAPEIPVVTLRAAACDKTILLERGRDAEPAVQVPQPAVGT